MKRRISITSCIFLIYVRKQIKYYPFVIYRRAVNVGYGHGVVTG